jgi:hypothetical protein
MGLNFKNGPQLFERLRAERATLWGADRGSAAQVARALARERMRIGQGQGLARVDGRWAKKNPGRMAAHRGSGKR